MHDQHVYEGCPGQRPLFLVLVSGMAARDTRRRPVHECPSTGTQRVIWRHIVRRLDTTDAKLQVTHCQQSPRPIVYMSTYNRLKCHCGHSKMPGACWWNPWLGCSDGDGLRSIGFYCVCIEATVFSMLKALRYNNGAKIGAGARRFAAHLAGKPTCDLCGAFSHERQALEALWGGVSLCSSTSRATPCGQRSLAPGF